MKFKINNSLAAIGQPYLDLVEAESEYSRVRNELLGPIREQIKTWTAEDVSPDEVVGKVFDNLGFAVKDRYDHENIPEGYNGNQWVIGNFLGRLANGDELTLRQQPLRMHFRRSVTDIIEKARYQGLRRKENNFFDALSDSLPEDFKGAFLFSAGGPLSFRTFPTEDAPSNRRGHWDYCDIDYRKEASAEHFPEGTIESLKNLGIKNPQNMNPWGGFWTPKADNLERWEFGVKWNKSTRLTGWPIGRQKPEHVEYGTYDITYADSDQTNDRHLGTPEMVKLTKLGGYIIVPDYLAAHILRNHKGEVLPLMRNPEGDYSLLQKTD